MINLLQLPYEILEHILNYCDPPALRNLNRSCKKLRVIATSHPKWVQSAKWAFVTNQSSKSIIYRSLTPLSPFDKCRIEANWKAGRYKYKQLFTERTNFMPWLQLDANHLWVSFGKTIKAYKRSEINNLLKNNRQLPKSHFVHILGDQRSKGDINRFIKKANIVLWNQDENISAWCQETQKKLFDIDILQLTEHKWVRDLTYKTNDALDFEKDKIAFAIDDTTYISSFGSFMNGDIPAWRAWEKKCWRLKFCDKNDLLAGASRAGPMYLYDTQNGVELSQFGGRSFNASVDIAWHGSVLLSGGYDATLRLWDPRVDLVKPQLKLHDPFDSTIYCISSDDHNTAMCGLQTNARVNSYDIRAGKILQTYFMESVSHETSPIYGLSFDPTQLFCVTSRDLHLLDFGIYEGVSKDYREWLSREKPPTDNRVL